MILNTFLFISILASFAMSKECINYYDGNSDNKLYFSSLVDLNLLNLPNQELSYLQSRSNNPNLEFEAIRRLKIKNTAELILKSVIASAELCIFISYCFELPVKPFVEQAKLKQAEKERLRQEAEEREQRLKQAYGIDL